MTNVEAFANKVFNCDMAASGKHLQNTSDRTAWYKVNRNTCTMLVPGLNVLRVNQPEVEKFLAAVESFIVHDLDDPIFNWTNLNLVDYSGESCEEGLVKLRDSFSEGQLVAADTETRYLKWDGNKLLSIGFATDDDTCVAFYDGYPVSLCHALIIPKRHVANYFDLTNHEREAMNVVLQYVKQKVDERFHPDGYNIGINVGEYAGQSVFHCHMHLIPRYKGDVENPKGGVRGVIPSKQKY